MALRRSPRKHTASADNAAIDTSERSVTEKARKILQKKISAATKGLADKAKDAGGEVSKAENSRAAAGPTATKVSSKKTGSAENDSPIRERGPSKSANPIEETATPKHRGRPPKKGMTAKDASPTATTAKGTGTFPRLENKESPAATSLPAPAEPDKSTDSPPKRSPAKGKGKATTKHMEDIDRKLTSGDPSPERRSRSKSPSKDRRASKTRSRSPSKRETHSPSRDRSKSPAKSPSLKPTKGSALKVAKTKKPYKPTPVPPGWVMGVPRHVQAETYMEHPGFVERFHANDAYGEALRAINAAAYRAAVEGEKVSKIRDESVRAADQKEARESGVRRGEFQKALNERGKGAKIGDIAKKRKDDAAGQVGKKTPARKGLEAKNDDNNDGDDDDGNDFVRGERGGKKPSSKEDSKDENYRPQSRGRERSSSGSSSGFDPKNGAEARNSRRATSPGRSRAASPAKGRAASPSKGRATSISAGKVPTKPGRAISTDVRTTAGRKRNFSRTQSPEPGALPTAKAASKNPYIPGRGNIRSVTNPEFIPNTNVINPFFETLPTPEVWHQHMPPYFTAGETPFMEQAISRQMNAELEQENDRDAKTTSLVGRAAQAVASLTSSFLGTSTTKTVPVYPPKWALPLVSEDAVNKTIQEIRSRKALQPGGSLSQSRAVSESVERPLKRVRGALDYQMSGAL